MPKQKIVPEQNAEQKIMDAAKMVFKEKGYSGARTQQIADAAGISKALLHYYFRSKELLFEHIFDEEVGHLVKTLTPILDAPIENWEESLRLRVYTFIEYFQENDAFFFILREVHQNPELADLRKKQLRTKQNRLLEFFETLVSDGRIKSFSPGFLYMFMQSICSYPLINATLFKHSLRMSDAEFTKYMQGFKKEAADFFISAIKK